MKPILSIFFHSKINGLTKYTNIILKQYLKAYANYDPDKQIDFLFIIEFEANLDQNNFSDIASFFIIKRYHPYSGRKISILFDEFLLSAGQKKIKTIDWFIKKIEKLKTIYKKSQDKAQQYNVNKLIRITSLILNLKSEIQLC